MMHDIHLRGHHFRSVLTGRPVIMGAALSAVVAGSLLAAPVAAPASAAANLARTGRIFGLVTGHGRPLKGVCVFATEVHLDGFYETHTSKTGHYAIGSIAPGRYYVTFAGCLPAVGNWLHQWYRGVNSPLDSPFDPPHGVVALRVRAGKALTGIDARLKRGGSISGTVVSASTGGGLRHICVTATSNVKGAFGGEYTLRSGHYVLNALFPATYRVEFGCGGVGSYNYAPQWWRSSATDAQATPIRVAGAVNVRNVDGRLGPGGVITGTVRATNASGPPLPGVCVNAVSSTPGVDSAMVFTGPDGSYRLAGLATAKYVVIFDPDCDGTDNYAGQQVNVQATAGTTVSGVDAYLQPES